MGMKSAFNVGSTMSEVDSGLPWWKNPNDRFYKKIKKKHPLAVHSSGGGMAGIFSAIPKMIGNILGGLTGMGKK